MSNEDCGRSQSGRSAGCLPYNNSPAASEITKTGIEIHVMAPYDGYELETARRLRELGVTAAIYTPRNPYLEPDVPLRRKRDMVRRIADEIIARL